MKNLDISLPETQYVGRRKDGDGILGFMVPEGSDAARRKEQVDRWARKSGSYGWQDLDEADRLEAITIKNDPMDGFTLGRIVQHGHGRYQGDIKWRVADPRGFELEITAANLVTIIAHYDILKGGRINGVCHWARSGQANILVPVVSEEYQTVIENTTRKSKSADVKNLKPGDDFVLQNGTKGRYLGRFHPLDTSYPYGAMAWSYAVQWEVKKTKKHYYMVETDYDPLVYHQGTLKLSEIIEGQPLTEKEAMDIVLGSRERAVINKNDHWGFALKPIDYGAVTEAIADGGDISVIVKQDGKWFSGTFYNEEEVSWPGRYIDHDVSKKKDDHRFVFREIDMDALTNQQCIRAMTWRPDHYKNDPNWGWGYATRPPINSEYVELSPFVEMFTCVMYIEHGEQRWVMPHNAHS